MSDPTFSSLDQLKAFFEEGKISAEEYEMLRAALETREAPCSPRPPEAQARPRLGKSWKNRRLGGVCAGIAEYFGIDPGIVRAIFVIFLLASGGAALLAYLVLYCYLPWRDPDEVLTVGRATRDFLKGIWGFPIIMLVLWTAFQLYNFILFPKYMNLYQSLGRSFPSFLVEYYARIWHPDGPFGGYLAQCGIFGGLILIHVFLKRVPRVQYVYDRIVAWSLALTLAFLVVYPLCSLPKTIG